jgi:superfamily II DNA or RNA helicase
MIKSYLYCVGSEYTDQHGTKKLGYTSNPVHRMCVYNTGDAPGIGLEKRYDALWQITATTPSDGFRMEHILHTNFSSVRQKRDNGKNTEWFAVSCENVRAFLNTIGFVVRELSAEEIALIHDKTKCELLEDIDEEKERAATQKALQQFKTEFFDTFLGKGVAPRRIQLELWDKFDAICCRDEKYRGIVQWATGTGKTVAMLMMIVHVATEYKQKGRIFRGLIIAPTNDIFDTIMRHIQKLINYDMVVCEGHNARMSSLHIPLDRHVLVTATHAALTEMNIWDKLPAMSMVHYDEVHRATGDGFYAILNERLIEWDTQYLTGTSATPKTCSTAQHAKIMELFGQPMQILHKCNVDEAISEGWIARPRFGVHVVPTAGKSRLSIVGNFVHIIKASIQKKKDMGLWLGGKVIAYLPFQSEVRDAILVAKTVLPECVVYSAVNGSDALSDDVFVDAPVDGTPRILFACERYRQGSDIRGIEMTVLLMGNTIGANVIIQVAGRALRLDYEGKEGWCVIVRPSDDDSTEDSVMDSIVLQIMDFIEKTNVGGGTPSVAKIRQTITEFFGDVAISGKVYNIEETIGRIQAMYVRKEFDGAAPKEKYHIVRNINKELGLASKHDYVGRKLEHIKYIADPPTYFKASWTNWSNYLGVDTSRFAPTKSEWICRCKELGIGSWGEYQTRAKNNTELPTNPEEMYGDYDNWDKEFGVDSGGYEW